MKVVIDDCRLERMDVYTDPLNDKIKRQAAEITRLLVENEKLKAENGNVIWEIEQAFDRGCNAAWKLAQKIAKFQLDGGYSIDELKAIFGHQYLSEIFYLTYTEAAAKVAEWERAKEEIHVGDIVRIHEGNDNDLCIICSSSDGYYNAVDEYGAVYPTLYKKMISKTGRHIDVDAWLAQIGGEEEWKEKKL